MKSSKRFRVTTLALAVTVLASCAVTPEALTPKQHAALTQTDLQALFGNQEPVDGPLSLEQAIARAIRYNLDQRVELMGEALAQGQLETAKAAMLPQLATQAGYSNRSNDLGSSSRSLEPPYNESLVSSTSQDRQLQSANLSLVWNVLDFGVSHVMAQQQADRILVAQEKHRKVIQNIVQDVRYAFWRALSAQHLLDDMDRMLRDLKRALARSEKLQGLGLSKPQEQLLYRKSLLEMARKMWDVREELSTANTELAALINAPPGQPLELVAAETPPAVPELDLSIEKMEAYALAHRPELREEHYLSRISAHEVRKATLRMLPGLEIALGGHYDSNSYAANNYWAQLGVNVSWNLFNLFTGPKQIELAKTGVEVDKVRRYAMSVAVLTQVNLATGRFATAREQYQLAYELMQVEQKLFQEAQKQQQADSSNELNVLKARTQALLARMKHLESYAELQNALGRIQHSLGLDVSGDGSQNLDADAKFIGKQLHDWQQQIEKSS